MKVQEKGAALKWVSDKPRRGGGEGTKEEGERSKSWEKKSKRKEIYCDKLTPPKLLLTI